MFFTFASKTSEKVSSEALFHEESAFARELLINFVPEKKHYPTS